MEARIILHLSLSLFLISFLPSFSSRRASLFHSSREANTEGSFLLAHQLPFLVAFLSYLRSSFPRKIMRAGKVNIRFTRMPRLASPLSFSTHTVTHAYRPLFLPSFLSFENGGNRRARAPTSRNWEEFRRHGVEEEGERGGSATWTRAKLIAVFHRYHTVTVDPALAFSYRHRFFSTGIKDSFRLRFVSFRDMQCCSSFGRRDSSREVLKRFKIWI